MRERATHLAMDHATAIAPAGVRIAAMRHGQTDWNLARRIQGRSDVPLNERGREQAVAAAHRLAAAGSWAAVVTSPLSRAQETGEIIARALGLGSPRVEARLVERDYGEAEGMQVAEAKALWPLLDAPSAEPRDRFVARASEALLDVMEETPGVIVVAHGAMLRAAFTRINGEAVSRVLNCETWLLRSDPARATPLA